MKAFDSMTPPIIIPLNGTSNAPPQWQSSLSGQFAGRQCKSTYQRGKNQPHSCGTHPCPYVSMSVSNKLLHICVVNTLVGWKYAARCNLSWLIPQLFWPTSTCRRLPGISCWYTLRKQIERRNNLASPPHIAIAASKPHGKQSNDIHLIGHQRPPRGLHKLKRGSAHYY